jgi:hypothetical protein
MPLGLVLLRPMRASARLCTIAALAAACGVVGTPVSAQSTPERRNARLTRDCAVASKALGADAAPNVDWAFETIRWCDETGPAVLAKLWATPPSDAVQLDHLVQASASLLDQRLFDAVMARAKVGSPLAARVAAFRVLAMYLDEFVWIRQRDLETARDTSAVRLFGVNTGGAGQSIGSQPPSRTYAAEIRTLLRSLVSDPDPIIRQDGRDFVSWLHLSGK